MNFELRCRLLLLVLASASACGNETPSRPTDASVGEDAVAMCLASTPPYPERVKTATRSRDGKGFCCAPDAPTCSCGSIGMFVVDLCQCGTERSAICDLAPPDWMLETDEHGCAVYRARSPSTACCNCPPIRDASVDAGDAAIDAAMDAAGDARQADAAPLSRAELCTSTGGSVGSASCCGATTSFPDTCLVGACGCSPANSHTIDTCTCPANECFGTSGCQPRSVCTPGLDQTCNDSLSISSLHGHCESDGSCTCKGGFAKNPATGKCL